MIPRAAITAWRAHASWKVGDPAFYGNVLPLLATQGDGFDPQRAYELVMDLLISRLPGEPWKR